MIKRMGLFQRRQDLTPAQFSNYWAKKHSPLVLQMPKFKSYTQNHTVDFLPDFSSQHPSFALDGIAEMYWDNMEQMQEDFEQLNAIGALRQDETEFMSHISVCIAEEMPLAGEMSAIKIMLCLSPLSEELLSQIQQKLRQALPNMTGVQLSQIQQAITRPQLPALEHIPQIFITLWFKQYAHALQDFNAAPWEHFYQTDLFAVERVKLLMVSPLQIRARQ